MPRLIVTEGAARGLEQCRQFLLEKNPHASMKAAQTIERYIRLLSSEPEMGRPVDDVKGLRELIIPFGASGYVALYRFTEAFIYILAFKHQKKAGY